MAKYTFKTKIQYLILTKLTFQETDHNTEDILQPWGKQVQPGTELMRQTIITLSCSSMTMLTCTAHYAEQLRDIPVHKVIILF